MERDREVEKEKKREEKREGCRKRDKDGDEIQMSIGRGGHYRYTDPMRLH